MLLYQKILQAEKQIHPYVRKTFLEESIYLSRLGDCRAFLKTENLQYTGSFKVRGAMNKLLSLSSQQKANGVVVASSGNHGVAVSYGLRKLKMRGIVFLPEKTSSTKIELIKSYGAEVNVYGSDCVITEAYARGYAKEHNMVYISPYNDLDVIAGQGTVGCELKKQLKFIDTVIVAVGRGGLISGISAYLKPHFKELQMIGSSPQNSPVMIESIKAGKIIEKVPKPTLSDGTAGGIEKNAITFPLCQKLIDQHVLVSEEEIKEAILWCMQEQRLLIEGSAAVAIAAFFKLKKQLKGKSVVIILCGANISMDTLKTIIH